MKKIYYLLLMTMIFVPQVVFAVPSASISVSANSVEKGKSVTATIKVIDTAAWNIKMDGSGAATCSEKYADVTADAKSTTKLFSLTCTPTAEGIINFKVTGDITSDTGTTTDISISKQVTVTKAKSSDNMLKELKVNGTIVSGFSSTKTSYTLKDNLGNSINITAVANDSKATISGTGNKSLRYGNNTFKIIVTAENGSQKTYSIIVNKPDGRSSNNYLKSLNISSSTIKFDPNITNYSIKLEHDVNELVISAEAEDTKATVLGAGKKSLNDYSNIFMVVVRAENGVERTYTINAIRKDSTGNYGSLSKDNSVKSISITGYDINFSNEIKKYNVLVEDINEVEINVEPNDNTATINIQNNNPLKPGLNKVTVQVISESGDINEFLFNIYKIEEDNNTEKTTELENDIDNKNSNSNMWMYISIVELMLVIILIFKLLKKNTNY